MANAYHYQNTFNDELAKEFRSILSLGFDLRTIDDNVLWLDAADQTTLAIESGNKISQWRDKSTFANHAFQPVIANQPLQAQNSINSLPALIFSGQSHFFSISHHPSLNFDSGDGFTIFMVIDFDGYINQGSSLNVMLGKGSAQAVNNNYNIQTNSGNSFWFQSGQSELFPNNYGAINGAPTILTGLYNKSGTDAVSYVNGTSRTANTNATGLSNNTSDLIIGGDTGTVRYADGKYGEIIIYNRPLSTEELLAVHTYLSEKWGIPIQS